ncbi:MAG: hypothetical protein R3C10_18110 [Pirellulales bacterium]
MILPKPSWEPDIVEDVNEILERMKSYTNGSRAFVVYSHGTTVFSDSASQHSDEVFHETLEAVVMRPPDFKVMPMEDGNLMVRFSGPVCGLVLGKFYLDHQEDIVANVTSGGLLDGEAILSPQHLTIPESHYYAGLYGRAKLYCDVSTLHIQNRFAP